MFHAIKNGNLQEVQRLVIQDANILIAHPETKYLPIFWACKSPNLEVLAYIVEHTDVNVQDDHGNTIWHHLMKKECDQAILDTLCASSKVLDIGIKNSNIFLKTSMPGIKVMYTLMTALHCACVNGRYQNIKYLLDHQDRFTNFDIEIRTRYQDTPLSLAVYRGHQDIGHLLIANGANINVINSYGNSLLHQAVISRHMALVTYFVQQNFNIYAKNNKGDTPLSLSIQNYPIFKYLFDRFDQIPDSNLLINAFKVPTDIEVIKLLLSRGVDPNVQDRYNGFTPLHYICDNSMGYTHYDDHECLELINLLLDYGADHKLVTNRNLTCLELVLEAINQHYKVKARAIVEVLRNYQEIWVKPALDEP